MYLSVSIWKVSNGKTEPPTFSLTGQTLRVRHMHWVDGALTYGSKSSAFPLLLHGKIRSLDNFFKSYTLWVNELELLSLALSLIVSQNLDLSLVN